MRALREFRSDQKKRIKDEESYNSNSSTCKIIEDIMNIEGAVVKQVKLDIKENKEEEGASDLSSDYESSSS